MGVASHGPECCRSHLRRKGPTGRNRRPAPGVWVRPGRTDAVNGPSYAVGGNAASRLSGTGRAGSRLTNLFRMNGLVPTLRILLQEGMGWLPPFEPEGILSLHLLVQFTAPLLSSGWWWWCLLALSLSAGNVPLQSLAKNTPHCATLRQSWTRARHVGTSCTAPLPSAYRAASRTSFRCPDLSPWAQSESNPKALGELSPIARPTVHQTSSPRFVVNWVCPCSLPRVWPNQPMLTLPERAHLQY